MSDPINRLLILIISEAKAIHIPVSNKINEQIKINSRAKKRLGCCRYQNGQYIIEISSLIIDDMDICKQVLAHEILHTCPGCMNHGKRWKQYAWQMNQSYGYHISRISPGNNQVQPDYRYLLVCNHCHSQIKRQRFSSVIKYPSKYRCVCGGTLTRVK